MKRSNRTNRVVYRLWAPVYDLALSGFFRTGRERAMKMLWPRAGERMLLIGVGTGEDLPLLPQGVYATGVDLSQAMLGRARARLPLPGRRIELQLANAEQLPFRDGTFDAVLLNLVLSVVPDARTCMAEALRVLRRNGRAVVFDKFVADDAAPTWGRRLANVVTSLAGTDITRRLGDIVRGQACAVACSEPSLLGGTYRVVLLRRS